MTPFDGLDAAVLSAFGADYRFVRQGVDVTTVRGIFDRDWMAIASEDGPPVTTLATAIFVRAADVALVQRGDGVEAEGSFYAVQDIRPDVQGGALLILENRSCA